MKISILEKNRTPSGNVFHKELTMGTTLLLHEQVHDPSEKKSERRLQNGHHGSFRDCFAEALLFLLAVVRLVGEVAHHNGDADCRDDTEIGCTEGRNHEPPPQHAQGIAVEDRAEDHQEPDTDDTAEDSQCSHVFISSRCWITTMSSWRDYRICTVSTMIPMPLRIAYFTYLVKPKQKISISAVFMT
mgnify:CR=1 FL=1